MKVQWTKMAGRLVTLPGADNVQFDEEGYADIPKEAAEKLIPKFASLGFTVFLQEGDSMVENKIIEKDETDHILSSPANAKRLQESIEQVENGDVIQANEILKETQQEAQESLLDKIENKTTTVASLQQIASQFPKEEWEDKKKAELRSYLIEKFK